MRILFLAPRMRGGGAERVISVLSAEFLRLGHPTDIAVTVEPGSIYPLADGVGLIDLSAAGQKKRDRIQKTRALLASGNYDIAISFLTSVNVETILAKRGTGVPVVVSERNDPRRDPPSKTARVLRKLTYFLSDGFVFQTEEAKSLFSKKIQSRAAVIGNPIMTELPARAKERTHRVVNVGRLVPQKNQALFLEAFADFSKAFPDYTAEIYGEGQERAALEEKIASLGISERARLCGFSENVVEKICDAGMFVLTSDFEGMSNALLEAVALGVPTVSTDHPVGGARETIEDGRSGFLVPVGDKAALVEKMTRVASDPALAERFSAEGEKLRAAFSVGTVARRWLSYLEAVLSKKA